MNTENLQIIPEEVGQTLDTLERAGFQAYIVGGCVRDILRGKKPKDWDIATEATPEEIVPLFSHTFYENEFGTVGVVYDEARDETSKTIEVTTFRLESEYSDKRRPDKVEFSKKLSDDLHRRDFTINALALRMPEGERNIAHGEIVDLFGGKKDLVDGVIRAVGDPHERFREDGLRVMRAVRFVAELDFDLEQETEKALYEESGVLSEIAKERVRDEFSRIIASPNPAKGIRLMKKLSLLAFVVPELEETVGIEQGGIHKSDVFEHSLKSLQHSADREYSFEVRVASLLHDIGKPATRREGREGKKAWSFYGHEVVGARMTKKILERLRYSKELVEKITTLVRWHMFFADTEEITLSAVRRLVRNVGKENVWELMDLRTADRIGADRPKEKPYRLRKYQSMIEEAMRAPVSVGQLSIDGNKLITELKLAPGPKIGHILHALLEEVLDDPSKNTETYLLERARELVELSDEKLKELGEAGKIKKDKEEEDALKEIRGKYFVE